jgi:hypothetical protein
LASCAVHAGPLPYSNVMFGLRHGGSPATLCLGACANVLQPGLPCVHPGRAAAILRRRGVVVVVSSRVGKCNHARVCYRGSRRGQQRRETRRHRGCRSSSPRSRGPYVLVPDVSRMQRPRGTAPSSRTRLVPRWCLAGAARRCNALHVRCMRLAHESHSSSTDRGLMTTAHARRYRRRACA